MPGLNRYINGGPFCRARCPVWKGDAAQCSPGYSAWRALCALLEDDRALAAVEQAGTPPAEEQNPATVHLAGRYASTRCCGPSPAPSTGRSSRPPPPPGQPAALGPAVRPVRLRCAVRADRHAAEASADVVAALEFGAPTPRPATSACTRRRADRRLAQPARPAAHRRVLPPPRRRPGRPCMPGCVAPVARVCRAVSPGHRVARPPGRPAPRRRRGHPRAAALGRRHRPRVRGAPPARRPPRPPPHRRPPAPVPEHRREARARPSSPRPAYPTPRPSAGSPRPAVRLRSADRSGWWPRTSCSTGGRTPPR